MIRWLVCVTLVAGTMAVATDSAEAVDFGRRSRASYSSRSYPSRQTTGRSSHVIRGVSPMRVHVSPARYRYLKTFYPTLVRDAR